AVAWDAASLTATLAAPSVSKQPWGQQVYYEVSFRGEEKVTTNALAISPLDGYTQVLTNTSFESWTGSFPDGWRFLAEAFKRSNTVSRSGQSSLFANGLSPQEIAASG